MSRLRRTVATVPAMAMVITGAAMVSTAEAAPQSVSGCGTTISSAGTYNLTNDIGPCFLDGIDITHNNVVLDLNGHTITGSNTTEVNAQQVGVHLLNVRNVTVKDGIVEHFDAGVALEGGSGNAVTRLTVRDNVSHLIFTGVQSRTDFCDYGDGIVADNSNNNSITNNVALRNGPFSGISLVDNSDNNTVANNQVRDQDVENVGPVTPLEPNGGTLCGAGASTGGPGGTGPMGTGRPVQDEGIRVEGPGADNNTVANNVVSNASLYGIGIHPYACHYPPGSPTGQPNNGGNVIRGNTVNNTGATTHNDDPTATGIGVFENGPASIVCASSGNTIASNISRNNFQDGIQVGGRLATGNVVRNNNTSSNGHDGINVAPNSVGDTFNSNIINNNGHDGLSISAGAVNHTIRNNSAHGNNRFDGFDGNTNPPCDNNHYAGNAFGTVNFGCLRSNGGTGTLKAATDLAVAVTATPSRLHGNGTATYTVTVTNTGNAPADLQTAASNVLLTDTLPSQGTDPNTGVTANALFLSGSTSQGSCNFPAANTVLSGQDATCQLGTLAPHQSATVTINVAIASRSRAANTHKFQLTDEATVSTTSVEPNTDNNTASDTVVYTVT